MALASEVRGAAHGRKPRSGSRCFLRLACSVAASGLSWALASGCSGKDDEQSEPSGNLPSLTDDSDASETSMQGPSATIAEDEHGDCTITVDDTDCAGQMYEGENVPLDIYVLFDQSGSMCNCVDPPKLHNDCPDPECQMSRLEAVRQAIDTFLRDDLSAGISVGIGYFGQQALGETTCDEADYAQSAVGIDTLPDHADAVMESLANIEPIGETPTGPAITAACDVAQGYKREHPGHQVVLLLLTDGEPKAPVTCKDDVGPCCPTLDDAVARTEACQTGDPPIRTYVLGVGPFLENLEQIAEAGGTKRAYLVDDSDTSQEGSVSLRVLDALNAIRGDAAIPCQLEMPPAPRDQTLDYNEVNLFYADSECNGYIFPYVDDPGSCGKKGGWYYDDPDAPQMIQLCPSSCEQVALPGGQLVQAVGCETVRLIL